MEEGQHVYHHLAIAERRSQRMLTKLGKYACGLFYLIGGPLIHAFLMTQHRELYAAVDDQAWTLYQTLWRGFVLPNLTPLVILLVLFEMAAGALMLSQRKRLAELGQLGGLLFNLLLVPFWFSYGIPNLLLVLLHLWVLLQENRTAASGHWRPAF
jgi:hypothetical protein